MGNTCNYACWYCFPGSNEGTFRWPEFNIAKENLEHLISVYKQAGKTDFRVDLVGGEPTLWPALTDFVKHFYDFGCKFHLSTNGSRSLRWWETNGNWFDTIYISCHWEKINVEHVVAVADMLWTRHNNVVCDVLMDANQWDKCIGIVNSLLASKTNFVVNVKPIKLGDKLQDYTEEQLAYLQDQRKRNPPTSEIFKPKEQRPPVEITHDNGNVEQVSKNYVLLNNLNQFKGWKCNLGVDAIFIKFNGDIGSVCGNDVLGYPSDTFNFYDVDFSKKFKPEIKATTCKQRKCMCQVGFLLLKSSDHRS
jgi:organic radical activating enzyme